MWLSAKAYSLLQVAKETADSQRAQITTLQAENVLLRTQLTESQTNFRWLATRVNQLEVERAGLMEKAYNIKTIVPEIAHAAQKESITDLLNTDMWNDVGDTVAPQLGYQRFDVQ